MRYKFRAECVPDIFEVEKVLGIKIQWDLISELRGLEVIWHKEVKLNLSEIERYGWPSPIGIIKSKLSLDELRDKIRCAEDCHVIRQTLALEAEFTCERDYDA